jgi:hypothetical protein
MDEKNFTQWFTTQLLPNIADNAVIIMDNAPYYNMFLELDFGHSEWGVASHPLSGRGEQARAGSLGGNLGFVSLFVFPAPERD